jgi:hypothetical protein
MSSASNHAPMSTVPRVLRHGVYPPVVWRASLRLCASPFPFVLRVLRFSAPSVLIPRPNLFRSPSRTLCVPAPLREAFWTLNFQLLTFNFLPAAFSAGQPAPSSIPIIFNYMRNTPSHNPLVFRWMCN